MYSKQAMIWACIHDEARHWSRDVAINNKDDQIEDCD